MYLGVDYYPEHWDSALIDEDIDRIKKMGANIIRIGEFAWHLMENQEGEYDFAFFDMVIEKAKKQGLKIIFGTPTATFPAWLAQKHQSILSEDEFGHKRVFGGRRQYCFNSEVYSEYTKKIVSRLVEHYKDEESIIAWQIDNELGHEGSDMCYCHQCEYRFREFLKNKYKEIKRLNDVYGTIFWGQTYNNFGEVPAPRPTITMHNPTLSLDWARFRSYSINNYAKLQIDLVKGIKGEHQKVTHNFSGGFFEKAYDLNKVAEELDFASYDNYPVWGGLREPLRPSHIAMTLDYIRGLKDKNYWIAEEIMGAQGHNIIGYLPRPNEAKMWAYQAVAHGCENMLFFRWRGMTKGAEQFCLGIINQDNEEGRKFYEAQSFMRDISNYEEVINSKIKSDIAVLYDFDNNWSWHYQQQSSKFNFTEELLRLYTPFYELNTNIDVISVDKNFAKYKVLIVPVMQIIDDNLGKRFEEFVNKGGTIVFSFRAGIKDKDNNLYFGRATPCNIREISGIKIKETEALQEGKNIEITGVDKYNNRIAYCQVWRDLIIPENAKVLYKYNDKFYSENACITENEYGKGKVYYIGGGVDIHILKDIAKEIIVENRIRYIESQENLEVYIRDFKEEEWMFVNNHSSEKMKFQGEIIGPYGSKIVKKDKKI